MRKSWGEGGGRRWVRDGVRTETVDTDFDDHVEVVWCCLSFWVKVDRKVIEEKKERSLKCWRV